MRLAVLGLLDIAPMTGYDLKKAFDATIGHFWAGDQSQVYRTLSGLVGEGLATVELVPQVGKPNRKLHRLTDSGRAELRQWLSAPLPPLEPVRDAFLARVFFAGRLDAEEIRALLGQRRDTVATKLAELESIEADEPGDLAAQLRLATLRHGIAHLKTELAWLDEVEGQL